MYCFHTTGLKLGGMDHYLFGGSWVSFDSTFEEEKAVVVWAKTKTKMFGEKRRNKMSQHHLTLGVWQQWRLV